MTAKARVSRMAAVLITAVLILVGFMFAAQGIVYAEELLVKGIVEDASINSLTVKSRDADTAMVHDIKGVQVLDMNENAIPKIGSALHGQVAHIVYRDGKVVFVKIFPLLPE